MRRGFLIQDQVPSAKARAKVAAASSEGAPYGLPGAAIPAVVLEPHRGHRYPHSGSLSSLFANASRLNAPRSPGTAWPGPRHAWTTAHLYRWSDLPTEWQDAPDGRQLRSAARTLGADPTTVSAITSISWPDMQWALDYRDFAQQMAESESIPARPNGPGGSGNPYLPICVENTRLWRDTYGDVAVANLVRWAANGHHGPPPRHLAVVWGSYA